MLRFLLDEHLSPRIARQLASRNRGLEADSLQTWQAGAYFEACDERILAAAREAGWCLVTWDLRTIPDILKAWSEQETHHGGVVFVDERTLATNDIGGIVLALESLWRAQGQFDWTDRVVYLRRAR